MKFSHEDFMRLALDEAIEARNLNEVPVGAIIIQGNKVIGSGHNTMIRDNSVTGHAELNAINEASRTLNNYRLLNCDIYITLEPCHMCAKALIDARVSRLVYSSFEPKTGAITSIDNLYNKPFNHKIHCEQGLLEQETSKILKNFFKTKRN